MDGCRPPEAAAEAERDVVAAAAAESQRVAAAAAAAAESQRVAAAAAAAAEAENRRVAAAQAEARQRASRAAARVELAKAVASREDTTRLETAILAASEAGVDEAQILPAFVALEAEIERASASKVLAAAKESRSVGKLKSALAAARKAKVDETQIAEAVKILEEEARKAMLRQKYCAVVMSSLRRATESGNVNMLRAALTAATDSRVDGPEVAAAREALRAEELREAALNSLDAALASALKGAERELTVLKAEIAAAVSAGVAEDRVEAARAGADVISEIREAAEQRDPGKLMEALAVAEKAGMEVDAATYRLLEELEEAAAAEELALAVEARDVARLRAAVEAADSAGVNRDDVQHANDLLASLAAAEELGAAFEARDVERLRAAIRESEKVGGDKALIQDAHAVLIEEEFRLAASVEVERAMEGRDKKALKAAIMKAEKVGVDPKLLNAAQAQVDGKTRGATGKKDLGVSGLGLHLNASTLSALAEGLPADGFTSLGGGVFTAMAPGPRGGVAVEILLGGGALSVNVDGKASESVDAFVSGVLVGGTSEAALSFGRRLLQWLAATRRAADGFANDISEIVVANGYDPRMLPSPARLGADPKRDLKLVSSSKVHHKVNQRTPADLYVDCDIKKLDVFVCKSRHMLKTKNGLDDEVQGRLCRNAHFAEFVTDVVQRIEAANPKVVAFLCPSGQHASVATCEIIGKAYYPSAHREHKVL